MSHGWIRPALVYLIIAVSGCASSAEIREQQSKKNKQVDTQVQLAVEYMSRKKWAYAREKAERALELDSDSSAANNVMGLLLWKLRKPDEAEGFFQKAVEVRPDDAEAQNNFGVFLCEQNKVDEALEHFIKAASNPLYKTPERANLNAGLCLMKKPDIDRAEKFLRTAIKQQPKLSQALLKLAEISVAKGHLLSARAFIQRYFQSHRDTPEALALGVKIEKTLGGRDAEASYRLRLRGKFPESAEAARMQ